MAKFGTMTVPDMKRVARATRIVEGSPRTYLHVPERVPRNVGGGCSCLTVHEIRIEGSVTSGTFTLGVGINDGSTITTETLTFNWNNTSTEVQTEYETHSKIAASGADILVKGGPFPNVAVYVVFLSTGAINFSQPLPLPDAAGLSGTNVRVKVAYMTDADWTEA